MTSREIQIKKALDCSGLFGIIANIELYKKVILAYDANLDERLKEILDRVNPYFRHDLLAVHECDGALTIIWKNNVPQPFLTGCSIATTYPDGSLDFRTIQHSLTSKSIEQKHKRIKLQSLGLHNLHVN